MAGACEHCGSLLPEDTPVCPSCGRPVPQAPPPMAADASAIPVSPPPTEPPAATPAPTPVEPPPVAPPPPAAGPPPVAPPPPAPGAPYGPAGGQLPPPGTASGQPAYPAPTGEHWSGYPAGYVPPPQAGSRPIDHILAYGYKLDLGALIQEGWRLFTADVGGMIGFTIVSGLIAIGLALTIVGMLFFMPLFAGFWVVPLLMLKGRPHGFGDYFGGFRQTGQMLLLGLVMGLLITIGFLLFIIPGIYLAVAWTWAIGLVIDRRMNFWDAMSTSMKVVNKNFWEVLLLVIVVGAINSVGSMVFVGSLVTIPLSFCILAASYRVVFGLDPRT